MLIYKENGSFYAMNQALSAIPAQCKRCGELFDLSYDFQGIDEERSVIELLMAARNPKMALCWDCRK